MSRHARIEVRPIDGLLKFEALSKHPHYLRLVAANGQVLATSEVYASRSNARRAVLAWLGAMEQIDARAWSSARPEVVREFDADGKQVQR